MTALCDVPCILHWEKIHEASPEAKIVLTQRDPGTAIPAPLQVSG